MGELSFVKRRIFGWEDFLYEDARKGRLYRPGRPVETTLAGVLPPCGRLAPCGRLYLIKHLQASLIWFIG